MSEEKTGRERGWPALIFGNLLLLLLILAVVEGVASLVLLGGDVVTQAGLVERRHTIYDEELGWTHQPDAVLTDLYGPGRSFHTNARGFRGREEVAPRTLPGRTRVVCSGDSFALGYGVDDRDTWCQRLSDLDPSIEPVNMGQGGYGLDQAFLWYRRDAAAFDHQLHLFSFITEDIHRMQNDDFFGYGKPVLRLGAQGLEVENVPVPDWPYRFPFITRNLGPLSRLRIVGLGRALGFRGETESEDSGTARSREDATSQVIGAIFRELRALNRERSSLPVVVHLPQIEDLDPRFSRRWEIELQRHAKAANILYINLLPTLWRLPPAEAESLFIRPGELDFAGAEYHYNQKGNRLIAKALYEKLLSVPSVARVLEPEAARADRSSQNSRM